MKNYYDILDLSSYEDNQDAILLSYKNGTKKLRVTMFNKQDIKTRLVLLNEAFLVLSDVTLKRQYDYCLSSNSENTALTEAILSKREKAQSFIQSKLDKVPKKRKGSKWPAILCGFFLLSALGIIMKTCTQATLHSSSASFQELGSFNPDSDWNSYGIANSFSISIPNTMELRHEYDEYTQLLNNNQLAMSNANAVFQQAKLAYLSSDAFDTYCRVIVEHYNFSPGEIERHDQTSYITTEDKKNFMEMLDAELGPYGYIDTPTFQWIDVAGTKALEARYRRTGDNGPVVCRLYLLPNYDEMVKIVVSYRESDANIWKSDLENVIRTFRWKCPK